MCGGGPSAKDIAKQQEKERLRIEREAQLKKEQEEFDTLARKRANAEFASGRRRTQETLLAAGLMDDENQSGRTVLGG